MILLNVFFSATFYSDKSLQPAVLLLERFLISLTNAMAVLLPLSLMHMFVMLLMLVEYLPYWSFQLSACPTSMPLR